MRISVAATILLLLMAAACHGITIADVQVQEFERGARVTLPLDSIPQFETIKGNDFMRLKLYGAAYKVPYQEFISDFFDRIEIKKEYNSTDLIVRYKYLTSSKVMVSRSPLGLIVSFTRISNAPLTKTSTPEIISVSPKSLQDMFKLIVNLSGPVNYAVKRSDSNLIIELPNANSVVRSQQAKVDDPLVKKVGVDQAGDSVMLSIAMMYPAYYKIYRIDAPYQLIIEIDKRSKSTVTRRDVAPGLTYMKVAKGLKEGATYSNILIADLASVEVFPYITERKEEEPPNIFYAILSIFAPPKKEWGLYHKEKVSEMTRDAKVTAGVNGTFFGEDGEPLGILMIYRELISYSIYDRTALIIDRNNKCFIDNVSLSGGISIEGDLLEISGINEKRETGDVIIYTPRYGSQTFDETPGLNLAVEDGIVKYISRGRTWIPKNGYVISADPTYHERLKDRVKVGSDVKMNMVLSTFSEFNMADIKHVIGGGPRLLKGGQIYVSKNIERFKTDVATSRAARTAVGITADGKLLLVTVDQNKIRYYPQPANASAGMTLEELAGLMQELGAVEAMNLDGGSSTTFVLEGKLINNPAGGEEREVSNAILLRPKP